MKYSFTGIWIIGSIIAALIITISVVFIIKALKRAKAIGMDKKVLTKSMSNAAIFAIVPSIPIVAGIGIMMAYLGVGIPWIRLTVIGALQYEISAVAAAGAMDAGATMGTIVSAVVIMTLAIIAGPIFNMIFYKKYQSKLAETQEKNSRMMNAITGALLGGMLAGIMAGLIVGGAFGVGHPTIDKAGITTYGEVTLITIVASILIMGICGVILLVGKQKWIESYALPLSMIGSLAIAYACIRLFA